MPLSQIENNLISGRIGNFYKYVNKKLNGSSGIDPLKSTDGQLLYNNLDKSALLNEWNEWNEWMNDVFINVW